MLSSVQFLPSYNAPNPVSFRSQGKRGGVFILIVALHLGLYYLATSQLFRQAAQAVLTPEVLAVFITPESHFDTQPVAATFKAAVTVKVPVQPRIAAPMIVTTQPEHAIAAPVQAPSQTVDSDSPKPSISIAQPAVSPPAPASAQPKTITQSVEYLQPPRPEYPPLSRRKGEEGKVLLRVLVNEKGAPVQVDVQFASGSLRLDEAARQAVLRAWFKPHVEDGKPVSVYAMVPINFQLD